MPKCTECENLFELDATHFQCKVNKIYRTDKPDEDLFCSKFEPIKYPICPLNLYFEGDEKKCDSAKCDYDTELRVCNGTCRIAQSIPAETIRQFNTGATRDTDVGKLDYEGFLSPLVLERYAQYLHKHRVQSDGQIRDADNWQKGIPIEEYIKSAWRHFVVWWTIHRGWKKDDGVLLEDSMMALIFNIMGYAHEILQKEQK